nr:MAG TPA: hypothetical protein [Caudoviricetes sp.]
MLRTLLFYYSISCVDGLRPQRPVHHIFELRRAMLSVKCTNG